MVPPTDQQKNPLNTCGVLHYVKYQQQQQYHHLTARKQKEIHKIVKAAEKNERTCNEKGAVVNGKVFIKNLNGNKNCTKCI